MIIEYILGFIAFLALTLALGKRAHEKNQDKQMNKEKECVSMDQQ